MQQAISQHTEALQQNGYAILPGFFTVAEADELLALLQTHGAFDYTTPHPVHRNLLVIKELETLVYSHRLLSVAEAVTGGGVTVTGSIILDKSTGSNWGLDWHQDTLVPVKERTDAPGYTGYTVEEGIPHMVIPAHLYDRKVYLRIHLDDCDNTNGAIWMLPGTHKLGIVKKEEIQGIVKNIPIQECNVKKGDVMLMHPLLLHKSPYSLSAATRRILQVDYTGIIPGI